MHIKVPFLLLIVIVYHPDLTDVFLLSTGLLIVALEHASAVLQGMSDEEVELS